MRSPISVLLGRGDVQLATKRQAAAKYIYSPESSPQSRRITFRGLLSNAARLLSLWNARRKAEISDIGEIVCTKTALDARDVGDNNTRKFHGLVRARCIRAFLVS
jgi:hypothetical protein